MLLKVFALALAVALVTLYENGIYAPIVLGMAFVMFIACERYRDRVAHYQREQHEIVQRLKNPG